MIKIENIVTPSCEQWEAVIRGMRNPMNSWDKSDSYYTHIEDADTLETAPFEFFVGEADEKLMKNLASAGSDHRKYLRMMPVYMDITAPLYWWKEFDTYKVGTVANSCSTMHKIHSKEFTIDDFSLETARKVLFDGAIMQTIRTLNELRYIFNNWENEKEIFEKDGISREDIWKVMIETLPSSYNQKRTVFLNYENLYSMYQGRKNHKLSEWREFCCEIVSLPMFSDIFGIHLD